MKKKDIINYLDKTSFTKGGVFDYFEEIDIESGRTIYLLLNDYDITVFIDDCEGVTMSFDKFVYLYENNIITDICQQ